MDSGDRALLIDRLLAFQDIALLRHRRVAPTRTRATEETTATGLALACPPKCQRHQGEAAASAGSQAIPLTVTAIALEITPSYWHVNA
jgi:hypothetical protein